ncbi:MAG: hypothetical protein FJ271_18685 [Planctomycetes bacterium]|nr:hypothetical protein [Planctomycetota bacterium]
MATQIATPPEVSPSRSRWRLRFLAGGMIVLLLAWLAPWLVGLSPLRHTIAQRIFSNLKGNVTVGRASLGWFSPLQLSDVVVSDIAGRPLLTAPHMESSRTLLGLLLDRSDLGSFRFERPVLDITLSSKQSNLEEVCAAWFAPDEPKAALVESPRPRTSLKVEFHEARASIRAGSPDSVIFEPLRLDYEVPADRSSPVQLAIEASEKSPDPAGRLSLSLATHRDQPKKDVEMRAELVRAPLAMLTPLLARLGTDVQCQGLLDARLNMHWGTSATDDDDIKMDGKISARNLDVTAGPLAGDRLQLESLDCPWRITVRGSRISIQQADLKCDVGQVALSGSIDPSRPLAGELAAPGWALHADLDLARLVSMLPRTLSTHQDTRLQSGRLTVKLNSQQGKDAIVWSGDLKTSDVEGTAKGTKIVWQAPLAVSFRAHQEGQELPVVDELRCDSGFLKVDVTGSPRSWNANARFDLDRLSTELGRFVDLGRTRLAGRGAARLTILRGEAKAFTVEGDSQIDQFEVAGMLSRPWKEANLKLRVQGAGKLGVAGRHALDAADLRMHSGDDELEFRLLEPVSDIQAGLRGKARLRVRGDLARWQDRLGPLLPDTADWTLTGNGDITAQVHAHPPGLECRDLNILLRNLACVGPGIALREPALDVKGQGSWNASASILEIRQASVTCPTLAVDLPALKMTCGDRWLVDAQGTVQADLERLGRWFSGSQRQSHDSLRGSLSGPFRLQSRGSQVAMDLDLAGKNLTLGPVKAPSWREPDPRIQGKATLDWNENHLQFEQLKIDSSLVGVRAHGKITRLSAGQELSLDGQLHYDLARLEPLLRPYLGKDFKIAGKDPRPVKLSGPLAVGPKHGFPRELQGELGFNWLRLDAAGCKIGPAEVRGKLKGGWILLQPIAGAINDGKLRIEPSLRLDPVPVEVRLAKGTLVHRAKITREMCAGALGYAAPALARVANADGLISVAVDEFRLPLDDPMRARSSGRLHLHDARFGTSPLLAELSTILLRSPGEVRLAKESIVNVRVADGKVHHDKLALVFPDMTIRTQGWVGLDGALGLTVEFPVPPKWVGNRKLTGPLAKTTIRVPMTGTLEKPRLDPVALRDASAKFARDYAAELLRQRIFQK